MRPNHQNKRMRGRNRNGKGPNPLSRTYESNGPDVKVRGTAQHIAEKYMQLGRDASATGDHIAAENYFQHAEHYLRLIAAAQEQYKLQNPNYQPYSPTDQDEDGDDEGAPFGHGAPQPDVRFGGQQPDLEGEEQPRVAYPPREPREHREFQPREPREPREFQPRQNREPRDGQQGERYNRDDRNRDDRNREDRFPRRERGEFRNRGERNDQPRFERPQADAAEDNVLPAFITAPVRAAPAPAPVAAEEPVTTAAEGAPESGEFPVRRRRGRPPRRPAEGEGE